jgi:endonuclease-8
VARAQDGDARGAPLERAVLELGRSGLGRLGPDILDDPPDLACMVDNLRLGHPEREVGDAVLDQRLVAGIGNLWRAEALWAARVSPWRRLGDLSDAELERVLAEAARLMWASVEGERRGAGPRAVYRRAGRAGPPGGATIGARGPGADNPTAYRCPASPRGEEHSDA